MYDFLESTAGTTRYRIRGRADLPFRFKVEEKISIILI